MFESMKTFFPDGAAQSVIFKDHGVKLQAPSGQGPQPFRTHLNISLLIYSQE